MNSPAAWMTPVAASKGDRAGSRRIAVQMPLDVFGRVLDVVEHVELWAVGGEVSGQAAQEDKLGIRHLAEPVVPAHVHVERTAVAQGTRAQGLEAGPAAWHALRTTCR